MPRPNPPPTPGSSSDLRGKEGSLSAPTFHLPPTAFAEQERASTTSSTPSANGSDSSYRPVSPHRPTSVGQTGPVITKDDFTLPPPPTRSRKIIQMQPKDTDPPSIAASTAAQSHGSGKTQAGAQTGAGRKRQSNAGNTAAGRKIARKTAHSLIERRRRSKMNEEFGVLKDMIPACRGQEMHKLAILQASIDYLRYLERCVTDLQAQTNSPRARPPNASDLAAQHNDEDVDDDEDDDDDEDEDEDMEDDQPSADVVNIPSTTAQEKSSSAVSLPSLSQITGTSITSPTIYSSADGRHYSISSTSQASYSPYFHSTQTSPAFGPQKQHIPFTSTYGLGSPALTPLDSAHKLRHIAEGAAELSDQHRWVARRSEQDLDQEATAALLMLNHDRRNSRAVNDGEAVRASTGMSVRDLLSG